tara:strand:- start:1462 stop:1647 length:186 start_codon:yes stop_codon:yes gene_type:complete
MAGESHSPQQITARRQSRITAIMDLGQGQQEKARLSLYSSLYGLFLVKIYTYESKNKSKSK